MQTLPAALQPLAAFKQWSCYKLVPSKKHANKKDKIPVSPFTGEAVSAHDSRNWVDAQTAIATANHWGDDYGVAFSLTPDDPFFFIDIDGCLEGSKWSQLATILMGHAAGAAIEVSQSGSGLHIIGQYSGEEPKHKCKNIPLNIELYTSDRFIALTGLNMVGDANAVCDAGLNAVISGYFPAAVGSVEAASWSNEAQPNSTPIPDDLALIEKAMKSGSVATKMGASCSFASLWNADEAELAKHYPDDDRPYDESGADAALAQHLAFWTGGNCERMANLMRMSSLVRDKWDWHKSYIHLTVKNAVANCSAYYNLGAETDVVKPTETTKARLREGHFQFMSPEMQLDYFKLCSYVCELHKVWVPNGSLMKSEQFNAMYGGYLFAMDSMGEKTTKKAFEALTESQCISFPKVDSICFRPELETGAIVEHEGKKLVNTYVPIEIHTQTGNPAPFLHHLNLLLPDPRDQQILLSYMAACVQYKGFKFQWAPLIQGTEGNGKTLFSRCVAYAVGDRYTHMPSAESISEKYNSWLFNKLFIGVEDIYVPEHKREVQEIMKPMITNDRLACRAMNTDQYMGDVRANFIFNSNHKDAVRKTENDRRFCVFYSAQQDAEAVRLSGMGGSYFPDLYAWLKTEGYAIVADYLANYEIADEFNPATMCQRAPETSSTAEVISMSEGSVEQEIREAIDEGRVGFCWPWVSSKGLDQLVSEMRRNSMSRNKKKQILQDMGYVPHPHLTDGRPNNPIRLDGSLDGTGKPRIYVHTSHQHIHLTKSTDIINEYLVAQGDALLTAQSSSSKLVAVQTLEGTKL